MKQKKKKRKRKIFLPLFLIFFIIIGFYSHQSYETAMHEQLPDSLIEFEQKYPEATDFVENYHKYKNKSFDLDVSHEVRKDNIPLFIQWDKRWGYKTYGSNFLGVNGCGPTSLSMVICGLTGKATWNPYKVAQFSQKQGYYISGQGTSWDLIQHVFTIVGKDIHMISSCLQIENPFHGIREQFHGISDGFMDFRNFVCQFGCSRNKFL